MDCPVWVNWPAPVQKAAFSGGIFNISLAAVSLATIKNLPISRLLASASCLGFFPLSVVAEAVVVPVSTIEHSKRQALTLVEH